MTKVGTTNNWKDIHSDFTPELQREWEDLCFTYHEAQEWIKIGGLTPKDAGFAEYLKLSSYDPEEVGDMKHEDFKEIRESYQSNSFFQWKVKLEEWKSVHVDFTPELIKSWRDRGFTIEQVKEWMAIGMSVNEVKFCAWLDIVGISPELVLNYGNYQDLQEQYQQSLIAQQIQIRH